MKRHIFLLCFLAAHTLSYSQSLGLPDAARRAIDARFPGWKFAKVDEEIWKFLRHNVSAKARPDLIKGDFDGDGRVDYAAYILHGPSRNQQLIVAALLREQKRFQLYILRRSPVNMAVESESFIVYLRLAKKGTEDYDYETNRKFTYPNDSVFVGYFEKAGDSYIYSQGKFRRVITSD